MANSWANSTGLDLHVVLDRSGRKVMTSLEAALRDGVLDGRLQPGSSLPPTRTLAADLGLARNTVASVYGRLVEEGWFVARQGSGTRVAEGPHLGQPDLPRRSARQQHPAYDLRAGFPDPTSFPVRAWATATRDALATSPRASTGYGPPEGAPALREALTRYLGRVRGVSATPDRLVVTAGFSGALRVLAEVLHRRGVRAVGVESHGHLAHRVLLRSAGLLVVALAGDADGALPPATSELGAVVLTPAHQFPLGVALSAARRAAFVRWAQVTGSLVVEDDYDSEFRFDRRAVGALQPHAPRHVVYAGTASKTLAPGLRVGWLAGPDDLVHDVAEAQQSLGSQPAALTQAVLAQLIDSGQYDRHVRRMRAAYRARRTALLSLVAESPGASISGLHAGLQAVVDLPAGLDEQQAVELCRRRGVAVEGLADFATADVAVPSRSALVVGYATPPASHYPAALAQLRTALGQR